VRRLCCYSLSLPANGHDALLVQLATSVHSLRAHNTQVDIVVFAYGPFPQDYAELLAGMHARVWQMETYAERLLRLCPSGQRSLATYPVLHKSLNFAEIAALEPEQVLLLDCDTYFRRDVAELFEKYAEADLVAREEVGCRRNHHGYDPKLVDEDELERLAASMGTRATPPFNLGVILLNHGLWRRLAQLAPLLIAYAWRFQIWMAANRPEVDSEFGDGWGIDELRGVLSTLRPAEVALALRFPSQNRWILDEVALWMTLAHLPNTKFADFLRDDVIQNGEFDADEHNSAWTVCHYFSQNMSRMESWARDNERAAASTPTKES